MVPASSIKVPRVSMYSGSRSVSSSFAYGAFTLSGRLSQNLSAGFVESGLRSEPGRARTAVWPLSISLAATLEIDVSFFSSGYLDVSVHRVPPAWLLRTNLCLPCSGRSLSCRVSPFRDRRISGYLLLPGAFRSLSRLSSALSAKASTLCSYQLNHLSPCIALLAMVCFSCFQNYFSVLFHMFPYGLGCLVLIVSFSLSIRFKML